MKISDQIVRTGMAVFITILWAIGYLVAIISSNYEGIIPATPVMLIAAAYLFGGSEIRKKGGQPDGRASKDGSQTQTSE